MERLGSSTFYLRRRHKKKKKKKNLNTKPVKKVFGGQKYAMVLIKYLYTT